MTRAPIINAMTVDVEDYFQVSAFEGNVAREAWDGRELRVERNIDRILELFDAHGVKGTFFTLGWIAERCPAMVRRLVDEGHELASHGWEHRRVTTQSPDEFRADVSRTRSFLQDLGGSPVNGYRAASYSIGASNHHWAHEVLAECGYLYSSSIAPIRHDLYGMPEAPRFRFRSDSAPIDEVPITTIPIAGRNINCGGGGWFRLFPYGFSRWALRQVNDREGQAGLFYFHPWEIDPEQPRVDGASAKTRFRHYLNLSRMESRLARLLEDFRWGRMDEVFFTDGERATWKDALSAA